MLARCLVTAVVLVTTRTAVADDSRPTAWLARATPGFGYSWDHAQRCGLEGKMFSGGFELGYFVRPGLLVGAATAIDFNLLPRDEGCGDGEGRLAMGMVVGPAVDWYPDPDLGLHALASIGYAELSLDSMDSPSGRGLGWIAAIGYDWRTGKHDPSVLIGIELRASMLETRIAGVDHKVLAPALLATFSFD